MFQMHSVNFEDPDNAGKMYTIEVPFEDYTKMDSGDLETIQKHFLRAKELAHQKLAVKLILDEKGTECCPPANNSQDSQSDFDNSHSESEEIQVMEWNTQTKSHDLIADVDENISGSSKQNEFVWTTKNPTSRDRQATEAMLIIMQEEKFQNRLRDKRTRKKDLFVELYNELSKQGFKIANTASAGSERLHQKWRNMEKSYLRYESNKKQTGAGALNKPIFYDVLHQILGQKHKVHPPNLQDTINRTPDPKETDTEYNKENESQHVTQESREHSKFTISTPKTTAKPKNCALEKVNQTLLLLEENQEKRFGRLEALLIEQNKQRERSNDLFEMFIKKKMNLPD